MRDFTRREAGEIKRGLNEWLCMLQVDENIVNTHRSHGKISRVLVSLRECVIEL